MKVVDCYVKPTIVDANPKNIYLLGFKRTAYIGESLCFASSAIPYDLLNHLTGRKQLPLTCGRISILRVCLTSFDGCPSWPIKINQPVICKRNGTDGGQERSLLMHIIP